MLRGCGACVAAFAVDFYKGADAQLARRAMEQDFDVLTSALLEGHSGLYRYSTRCNTNELWHDVRARIKSDMSLVDFYRLLSVVIAHVKCGHTYLLLPEDARERVVNELRVLPLFVRIVGSRVFAFQSDEGATGLSGAEIVAVNQVPAGQLLRRLVSFTPGDGSIVTSREWRITRGYTFAKGYHLFPIALYLELGIHSPFTLEYRLPPHGVASRVVLQGTTPSELLATGLEAPGVGSSGPPSACLHFIDDGRIAVLRIRSFSDSTPAEDGQELGPYLISAFRQLHARNTQTLIVDLRDNGGGRDELGKRLVALLLDRPFEYYEELTVNALTFTFSHYCDRQIEIPRSAVEPGRYGSYRLTDHPNWGLQHPLPERFGGRVYVLINGGSFSTTCEALSILHYNKRATFIGEESGGGYYGNSSHFMPRVTLPNSGIILHLPLVTYHMAVSGYPFNDRGLIPDHQVTYSIQELLAGEDKELHLALGLARGGHT
jgi:hypothetical protein